MNDFSWEEYHFREGEDPNHPESYWSYDLLEYDEQGDTVNDSPIATFAFDEGSYDNAPWGVWVGYGPVSNELAERCKDVDDPMGFFEALYCACVRMPNGTDDEKWALAKTIYLMGDGNDLVN